MKFYCSYCLLDNKWVEAVTVMRGEAFCKEHEESAREIELTKWITENKIKD